MTTTTPINKDILALLTPSPDSDHPDDEHQDKLGQLLQEYSMQAALPTLLAVVRGDGDPSLPTIAHAIDALSVFVRDIEPPGLTEIIDALIARFAEPASDKMLRYLIAEILGDIGEPVLEPVLACYAAMVHGDAGEARDARSILCQPLARIRARDDRIFDALMAYFADDPEDAAGYLADYDDPRAIEALTRAFDEYNPQSAKDPRDAAYRLHAFSLALDRLGAKATPERAAKLEAASRAVYDDATRREAAALRRATPHKDQRAQERKHRTQNKSRRKQQKKSRKKNR